jgi:hypothetical protein
MVGSEQKFFAASIAGPVAIGEPLPDWAEENASPFIAWEAVREIYYLELAGRLNETDLLWREIESEDPLGGVVALLQLWMYANSQFGRTDAKFAPEKTAPWQVKRLLEIGVKNWSRLDLEDTERRFFGDAFGTACSVLSLIGDEETVKLLESFAQDGGRGATAIEAIRTIKRRLRSPEQDFDGQGLTSR